MPIFRLDDRLVFPPPHLADPDGLLAVGGDLRPERLLLAYSMGIFPWYHEGAPILWHSPDPRAALEPAKLHVPRSLEKRMRKRPFDIRLDTAFTAVMKACATTRRPGQRGTWITREMVKQYTALHEMGFAHAAEAWEGDTLVGGLYGIALGGVFFGESMFARADDASKIAFVCLVRQLRRWGFSLIDCQQQTAHLERFGAEPWPRSRFLVHLEKALATPTRRGRWRFDDESAYSEGA